ncbi:MAG TPA: NAD(P)H-hydrate dehydratase [Candidatus Acidoferrum sp.]|nr:NAD(P)H-hydrate dehydratase [Candidatus Acidoferrum sp.]
MKILTTAEMREVDRLTTERHGIPSLTLMENAGRSVAEFIAHRFPHLERRRIVVLCGKGNNGGDGFVAARHLREKGANVSAYLFAEPQEVKGDAAANLDRWRQLSGEMHVIRAASEWRTSKQVIASAGVIVDALLGTGARGEVEGLLAEVIADINAHSAAQTVVAVDIPSGLNADSGEVSRSCVVADFTVTLTAPKIGMFRGNAPSVVGQLLVREIGSPRELIAELGKGKLWWGDANQFADFAVRRRPEGHKGDFGHALIVAGSVGKTGAAVLASWAALRAGAGLVTVATPEPALPIIAGHTPEVMTEPLPATRAGTISLRGLEGGFDAIVKGKRALAIGPGLSANEETQQFVRTVVAQRVAPIILDADGLNAFAGRAAELKSANGLLGVTPHPGEMARLVGCETKDVQSRRVELALKSAADWNACVVLKGHQTVIASPTGEAYINSTGNPGMGTGGTGDVLTGMLAGLVAQHGQGLNYSGYAHLLAFGAYLHGLAGDIAYADHNEAPLMASDLIRSIPRAYRRFFDECGRG